MVKKVIFLISLAFLLSGCGSAQIKCDTQKVDIAVPTNVAPAVVETKPQLETRNLTPQSDAKQVITAYRDDVPTLTEFAHELGCALAPFQIAAGQTPTFTDCSEKAAKPKGK